MYTVAILLIGVMVSSCATTPISFSSAQTVPADRIFLDTNFPLDGNAHVFFIRDIGFMGGGVYQHLYIDGGKVASLDPGEKVEFNLTPGEHIFGVIPTDPVGTHFLYSIDQDLKKDKQYFYRILVGAPGQTRIQRFFPQMP